MLLLFQEEKEGGYALREDGEEGFRGEGRGG